MEWFTPAEHAVLDELRILKAAINDSNDLIVNYKNTANMLNYSIKEYNRAYKDVKHSEHLSLMAKDIKELKKETVENLATSTTDNVNTILTKTAKTLADLKHIRVNYSALNNIPNQFLEIDDAIFEEICDKPRSKTLQMV
jgi:vacuolar-type H+-ATPase catalytic subunit A/Vma1